MAKQVIPTAEFPGFPDFRANVTFVPIQFFTVVLPHCSRGTVRIVGYALRKVLGWVDEHGNPTREQLRFTYRELIENAGVSRTSIAEALGEAIERRCLRCLQAPQPDSGGKPAQSGLYELCWDQEDRYTDVPAEFRGFHYPEAVLIEERQGGTTVRRPKAARKNIPNLFFDYLLPRERLSVIRVVGALLFYSIQWGPGGERKVLVSRSITELSRLTNLSRQHVHQAMGEAQQRGYVEQVDAGRFDPAAAQESRAATYGIRWAPVIPAGRLVQKTTEAAAMPPVRKGEREADRSEKVNGALVGKGERDQFEKVNGRRSEMVNGIRIKTELKTKQTTVAPPAPVCPAPSAAAESACQFLRQTGFDEKTARRLSGQRSLEIIQRQIEWLPLRHTTSNRLGLLRRAIEEDWPRPAAAPENRDLEQGRVFARYYYAAYHGNTGQPATEPFLKDVQVASKFVQHLLGHTRDEARLPEWGRQFGGFMRSKHRGDAKAKPNLSFALVLYGDEFLRLVQVRNSACAQKAVGNVPEAHHTALLPEYLAYVRLAEKSSQRSYPGLYAAFAEERRRTRHAMTGGLFLASDETLAKFDGEESRLLAFADFFRNHPQKPVLDLDQWDQQRNSIGKGAEPDTREKLSVRFSPAATTEEGERLAVTGVRAHPAASLLEPKLE